MPSLPSALVALLSLSTIAGAARAASIHERQLVTHRTELERRQGRPEAAASLAALVRLEEYVPASAIEAALRPVAEARGSDPLVAAQATYQLALAEARRGATSSADKRLQSLGLAANFQVLGPFDAQGRSGLGRVYPPEEDGADPRESKVYSGKEREISWRVALGVARDGAFSLDGLLRPDADAAAYVLAFARTDRPREAVLRLGSPGPLKVWAGGRVVLERNVVRSAYLDQDAVAISLPKGETPILIKTVVGSGAWRLFVRLTDAQGRRLTGVSMHAQGDGPGLPPAAARLRFGPARGLTALLRGRAERARGPAAPAAWLDYGRWLALSRAEDRDAKVAESALARAAGAEAALLLAEVTSEDEDRRRALERAAEAEDPGLRALSLAGLAELARQRRRDSVAAEHWRAALKADPTCVPATLALASEEQLAGLSSAALARLDALPGPVRELPRVRAARARALESLGRRREAEAELRAAWSARRTDLDLVMDLARAVRARGATDEAIALYQEVSRQRPDLTFVAVEWARLAEGRGDVVTARQVLEAAAARVPDEPTLHEELGRLLVRAGEGPAGLERLRTSLTLRPQNPTLRRFVDRLAAEAHGDRADAAADLARRWGEDGAKLAAQALASDAKRSGNAHVLLDKQVIRVHRNGLSDRFAQRLVHVRTDQAAREQQEFYVRYTPGSQEVEILRAQVYRRGAGGAIDILETTARDDRDLSEPWYGLYYDNRAEVVTFEGLRAGDVLEVQYTVSDVSAENALADYFGDMDFVAETSPRQRWEYVLIGPAERRFYFNKPKVERLERTEEKRGGEVIHRFVARDVPRVELEPSMPGFAEVAPYVHVSTYQSWVDVGRWYWHLVEDQLLADDSIRRAAREATANAKTPEEKVRALHTFVLENTRYVALEFGIHGYKPYRVTQVLSRRFGDCKDKASLLLVLLREVGIESELVLLRTRRSGRVEGAPASLAVFDHAIAYIPSLDLYLDGTAEFSGAAELPYEDQGVLALRVSPRAVTLVETPVLPSTANRAQRSWTINLEPSGAARVEEAVSITGQAAPEWREHYQTAGEREERMTKVWSGRFPGSTLESLQMEGLQDRDRAVVVRSVAQVPRLAEPSGPGTLRLPLSSRESDFVRSYARLSRRKHELLLAYPWQHEEVLTYRLPDGWHVAAVPEARTSETPFGRFRLEVSKTASGRELQVRSTLDVHRHRIPATDYAEFRSFLRAVDGALADSVVLRRDE